jgi:hypothetical protein
MQVADSTLATTACAMALDNSNAARLTAELHRAFRFIDLANRPGLNKMELAVQQMRAEASTSPATNSEVERLFERLNSTRRLKRKRESKPSSRAATLSQPAASYSQPNVATHKPGFH